VFSLWSYLKSIYRAYPYAGVRVAALIFIYVYYLIGAVHFLCIWSSARLSKFFFQQFLNILEASLSEGFPVDCQVGPFAAKVHAAGAFQNYLIIKVVFLQVVPDHLYHLSVTS
jgi:hypothetical protein